MTRSLVAAALLVALLNGCSGSSHHGSSTTTTTAASAPVKTIAGMPAVDDPNNIYSDAGAGMLSNAVKQALPLVYVPGHKTNNVTVIDPATDRIVRVIPTGLSPQHVVPSYDLTRLWVANNADGTNLGSLTPIDPTTGMRAGPNVPVDDPYNLYFTPDGQHAIVVAEALRRLDFRDPHTMALQFSVPTPTCGGVNHMDFSEDGSYLIATCEDAHALVKVDWVNRVVVGTLDLGEMAMPQDIRLGPNGHTWYVADMMGNQAVMVDGDAFKIIGTIDLAATGGLGAHGIYPSRDGTKLYISNRGSAARGDAPPHSKGSVSVVDLATNKVIANWPVPGGGSPDMGGVSADGSQLWLSGRFDDEVYVFDTVAGRFQARVKTAPALREPHGLCVWPQPGRYSLGHTDNTR